MNNFFDVNGIFYRALYKVYQIVVLNILFIVTSIPLATVGAATTALYATWFKMLNKTYDGHLARTYFKTFAANFKKATIIWIVALSVFALVFLSWPELAVAIHAFWSLFYLFILILTVFLLALTYVFPLVARFENSVGRTLKNAYIMSLANIAYSIVVLVVDFVLIFVVLVYVPALFFLWFCTAFALAAFINTLILDRVFDKYIKKEQGEKTE